MVPCSGVARLLVMVGHIFTSTPTMHVFAVNMQSCDRIMDICTDRVKFSAALEISISYVHRLYNTKQHIHQGVA